MVTDHNPKISYTDIKVMMTEGNVNICRKPIHSLVGGLFDNGPKDLGSIPGRVIPKTFKIVLDASLLNTQQYKVRIEGKVEQSRERSSALPHTSV